MVNHVLAIVGLALLCGAWVWLQRFIHRVDPQNPGLDRRCGSCDCSHEKRCAE